MNVSFRLLPETSVFGQVHIAYFLFLPRAEISVIYTMNTCMLVVCILSETGVLVHIF